MKLTETTRWSAGRWVGICLAAVLLVWNVAAQTISTTTVQGTVYLANGKTGSGTLQLSWPAFTTSNNLAVAAGSLHVTVGSDGFVSANLTPNLGASPAGFFYTAVYHMSDGTTSTEYWVVPAAVQVSLAEVRAQVMPAAQAVQAVSKAYVDQAIESLAQGTLTPVGGTLSGPLYLNSDPVQSLQAADKHYVDASFSAALPLAGGTATGAITGMQIGALYQVDQFPGADFGAKLQACLAALNATYGGTCDARNFTGAQAMAGSVTVSAANATVLLPCATIASANQFVVAAGTRNVVLRGCALRGASTASGSQGGTVVLYSGAAAAIQIGDRTYAADTSGIHLDNVVINTTASSSSTAQALIAYRTQEMDVESVYLLGNSNQTGMTLDGTGNYTGGTFYDNEIGGYQIAVNAIGHQVANSATTDWMNASTFVRLHIDCPLANGNPAVTQCRPETLKPKLRTEWRTHAKRERFVLRSATRAAGGAQSGKDDPAARCGASWNPGRGSGSALQSTTQRRVCAAVAWPWSGSGPCIDDGGRGMRSDLPNVRNAEFWRAGSRTGAQCDG